MTERRDPLVQFLLDRLDEEQALAQKAADDVAELNEIFETGNLPWRTWSRPAATLSSLGPIAEFIYSQTPDRVLAEIYAKRLIVKDYLEAVRARDDAAVSNLSWVFLRLAMSYAGHPDFREQWRP